MENKLLSCPFCGGDKVRISRSDGINYEPYYFVRCHKCGAEGPFKSIEAEAITAWNTRSRPEAVKRLIEAAKGALELMLTDSTCFGLGVCKYYTECTRPDGECQFVLRLQAALAAVEG